MYIYIIYIYIHIFLLTPFTYSSITSLHDVNYRLWFLEGHRTCLINLMRILFLLDEFESAEELAEDILLTDSRNADALMIKANALRVRY